MGDKPIKVLLVEGNEDDATLIRLALARTPGMFDVESAETLRAARARLASGSIDVVLLALSLPDADGVSALGSIRDDMPETPVIVLSGPGDDVLAARAMYAGAEDHLSKVRLDADGLSRAIRYSAERRRMRREIRDLVTFDELTGLHNRRGFELLAEHHLKLAGRTQQAVTILFVALDGMRQVNETFGREEGTQLLVDTAKVLRQAVRDSDVLARIGGDEFCVLLTGNASGAAATVLTRLVEAIATHNARSGRPYALSLSVGSATYDPEHPCTLDELIRRADERMHEERRGKLGR